MNAISLVTKGKVSMGGIGETVYQTALNVDVEIEDIEIDVSIEDINVEIEINDPEIDVEIECN